MNVLDVSANEKASVIWANWFKMVRDGLLALEMYSPGPKTWRQAHARARYAILQVLLRAGGGLVEIAPADDGTVIRLDESKIISVGIPALGTFLQRLNVYKVEIVVPVLSCTGDSECCVGHCHV